MQSHCKLFSTFMTCLSWYVYKERMKFRLQYFGFWPCDAVGSHWHFRWACSLCLHRVLKYFVHVRHQNLSEVDISIILHHYPVSKSSLPSIKIITTQYQNHHYPVPKSSLLIVKIIITQYQNHHYPVPKSSLSSIKIITTQYQNHHYPIPKSSLPSTKIITTQYQNHHYPVSKSRILQSKPSLPQKPEKLAQLWNGT
jgi:hypothetical protein